MNFGNWEASIHDEAEQIKRICSGQKLPASKVQVQKDTQSALFQGSSDEPYETTLDNCTCMDASIRRLPCKHMYRLALELGFLNDLPVLNKEAMVTFDSDNEAKRFFDFYKSGAISGEKYAKIYDALMKGK